MKTTRTQNLFAAALLCALAVTSTHAQETKLPDWMRYEQGLKITPALTPEAAAEEHAYTLGVQTVNWGMQFVRAARAMRSQVSPLPEGKQPSPYDPNPHAMNRYGHAKEVIDHTFRDVEGANTETVYSIAIVDLDSGPVVVLHPNMGERYYSTSVWDEYGNSSDISRMRFGPQAPPHALVRRGWEGQLPKGMERITLESRYVIIAPHTMLYGKDDLENVHKAQQGHKLVPLAKWPDTQATLPEVARPLPLSRPDSGVPAELVFFEHLASVLKEIDVRPGEEAFLYQLKDIGITKAGFDYAKLDEPTRRGLLRASKAGLSLTVHTSNTLTPIKPGSNWGMFADLGNTTDWRFRAGVGMRYIWGATFPSVQYAQSAMDSDGKLYAGKNNYRVHFNKDQLIPARNWRITMYNSEGYLVENPIRRYGIGDISDPLKYNADGSLDLYLQQASPGKDKEGNWLPAPAQGFFLLLRVYEPKESYLKGEYTIPPVTMVK
jgi:hypothetical protein